MPLLLQLNVTDLPSLCREVLFTKDAQPFLISGSGTLGWDQVRLLSSLLPLSLSTISNYHKVSANLVEPGENALVLHSGYFGDSFADWYVLIFDCLSLVDGFLLHVVLLLQVSKLMAQS